MKYGPLWLFALALVLRLLLIGLFELDGLYGQDAFAYFDCAREILRVQPGQLPCPDFYWPLGYPALAALFMLATHGALIGAQLSSIIAGAAVAPLTYWLVMQCGLSGVARLQQSQSALAAGLIAASCGMLMIASSVVMSDAAGLCWATLAAGLLLRWDGALQAGRASGRWLVVAAAALGLAIVTRWIYAGLLPAVLVFSVATLWRGRRLTQRSAWARLAAPLIAAGVLLLILLPQIHVTQASGTPLASHGWLADWTPRNALRTSFDTAEGHFDFRWPPLLFYAAPFFHPLFLFPLLTVFVFYGAWQLRSSPVMLLLGGWIGVLGLYFIGIPQENLRFGLAIFTPLAVLAGIGICALPVRLRALIQVRRAVGGDVTASPHTPIHWLLLAASLSLALPFTALAFSRLHAATAGQRAAIRYLQSQLPVSATVISFELSSALDYYTQLNIIDLFAQSPDSLRPAVCGGGAVYVYVEPAKLESQWQQRPAAQNFHWLRDRIGLQPIGVEGSWSLFRVRRCER
jgi:4-amino-4-deoxy-L-arabinose transferase-like glycosyltransferase